MIAPPTEPQSTIRGEGVWTEGVRILPGEGGGRGSVEVRSSYRTPEEEGCYVMNRGSIGQRV